MPEWGKYGSVRGGAQKWVSLPQLVLREGTAGTVTYPYSIITK